VMCLLTSALPSGVYHFPCIVPPSSFESAFVIDVSTDLMHPGTVSKPTD
jgi:hypothetical protein